MAGVLGLGGEGSGRDLHAQDVFDHVGPEPAHQRGAAGGVVGLSVVEEEAVHLRTGRSRMRPDGEQQRGEKTKDWSVSYTEAVLGCQRLLDLLGGALDALEAHEAKLSEQTEPQ